MGWKLGKFKHFIFLTLLQAFVRTIAGQLWVSSDLQTWTNQNSLLQLAKAAHPTQSGVRVQQIIAANDTYTVRFSIFQTFPRCMYWEVLPTYGIPRIKGIPMCFMMECGS